MCRVWNLFLISKKIPIFKPKSNTLERKEPSNLFSEEEKNFNLKNNPSLIFCYKGHAKKNQRNFQNEK